MPDVADESGDAEQIAKITGELAEALRAGTITVKLQNGREIVGPLLGLSLKKRDRRGEVTWSGSLRIQIDPGELEIDCMTIDSVTPN